MTRALKFIRIFDMKRRDFNVRLLLCALACLAVSSCQTVQTTAPGTVGVDRKQTMLLSSSEVNKGAQAAYAQAIQETSSKGALNRDAAQVARVRAVTTRLIPATATFRKDAPGWAWEFRSRRLSTRQQRLHSGQARKSSAIQQIQTFTESSWCRVRKVGKAAFPAFLTRHPAGR